MASGVGALVEEAAAKAEDAGIIDPETERDKDNKAIVQGLLHKRVVWYDNSILQNYWFFLCQKHSLFGIAFCHTLHPYRRIERVGVFLSVVVSALGLALLLADSTLSEQSLQNMAFAISIYLAMKKTVLRNLVTCGGVQEGSALFTAARVIKKEDSVKTSVESCGCKVVAFSWVVSLIWLISGLATSTGDDFSWHSVLVEFFCSQIYSSFIELGFISARFLQGWYGCIGCISGPEGTGGDEVRKEMEDKYPEGIAYPKDKKVFSDNDRSRFWVLCMKKEEPPEEPAEAPAEAPEPAEEDVPGICKV